MTDTTHVLNESEQRNYYSLLDLCRFLAALAVLIYHFRHFYFSGVIPPETFPAGHEPAFALLEVLYRHGNQAVPFFWVLSGFVFAHVYGERTVTGSVFWGRRFARLYPLHLLTLLAVAGLQAFHLSENGSYQLFGFNDTYHFILNLLMASSWGLEEGLSFNAPIWSVSAEVLVYFVFWISLPFFNKYKWLGPLTLLCIALIAAAIVPQLWAPWCGAYFFLGVLVFQLTQQGKGKEKLFLALCAALVGVGIGLLSALAPEEITRRYLLMLVFPAFVGLMSLMDTLRGPKEMPLCKSLGAMSYAMYLIHVPLQLALWVFMNANGYSGRSVASVPFLLTYLSLVLITAAACHYAIEKPLSRLIRRRYSL